MINNQPGKSQAEIISESESGRRALMKGGLLTELGPVLKKLANQNTILLEEAQQILGGAPGKLLSEIVIGQRDQNSCVSTILIQE